jgi:hypothetical protein
LLGRELERAAGQPTNSGVSDVANPTPVPVDGGLTFSTLDAGGDHTCGITTQGAMYCWAAIPWDSFPPA